MFIDFNSCTLSLYVCFIKRLKSSATCQDSPVVDEKECSDLFSMVRSNAAHFLLKLYQSFSIMLKALVYLVKAIDNNYFSCLRHTNPFCAMILQLYFVQVVLDIIELDQLNAPESSNRDSSVKIFKRKQDQTISLRKTTFKVY